MHGFFNTYDYQDFKSVEEMKSFQGKYGFNIGKRRYHIDTENALDVYLNTNEKYAKIFCDSIRTLAKKPENIDNLESYLVYHFDGWLKAYGNNPEDLAMEMKSFANMEI